jgi:hypothetical protein
MNVQEVWEIVNYTVQRSQEILMHLQMVYWTTCRKDESWRAEEVSVLFFKIPIEQ